VTCGLILAAGESRRMGSPKALLEYRGETFLDRLIGLFARRCSPVIAVLGAEREMVRAGLRRAGDAELVENPDFHLGQLTSMQCGLRAVPAEADGVLFTLVDHPAVMPATIDALLGALQDSGATAPLRIPRCEVARASDLDFKTPDPGVPGAAGRRVGAGSGNALRE
jgi:CTP:molybdopterin cytidylyltransferase MocA